MFCGSVRSAATAVEEKRLLFVAMDLSEEIEDVLIAYSAYRTLYKRKKRRMWIHPLLAVKTRYFPNLFAELRNDENKFFNYFRMSKDSFDELLSHLQSSS